MLIHIPGLQVSMGTIHIWPYLTRSRLVYTLPRGVFRSRNCSALQSPHIPQVRLKKYGDTRTSICLKLKQVRDEFNFTTRHSMRGD